MNPIGEGAGPRGFSFPSEGATLIAGDVPKKGRRESIDSVRQEGNGNRIRGDVVTSSGEANFLL
jgi:hypothetical protein